MQIEDAEDLLEAYFLQVGRADCMRMCGSVWAGPWGVGSLFWVGWVGGWGLNSWFVRCGLPMFAVGR